MSYYPAQNLATCLRILVDTLTQFLQASSLIPMQTLVQAQEPANEASKLLTQGMCKNWCIYSDESCTKQCKILCKILAYNRSRFCINYCKLLSLTGYIKQDLALCSAKPCITFATLQQHSYINSARSSINGAAPFLHIVLQNLA